MMHIGTGLLMMIPLVLSFHFFARSAPTSEFYSTVSQVIAAMYLAVAIEFFTGGGVALDGFGRAEFATLLALSWLGLIACFRGLVTAEGAWEPWTAGLAGMGLVASALLVTSNLADRAAVRNSKLVQPVVFVACLAPIAVFIVPLPN